MFRTDLLSIIRSFNTVYTTIFVMLVTLNIRSFNTVYTTIFVMLVTLNIC